MQLNDKYGYIDPSGHFVIPCSYKQALDFSDGLAAVLDPSGKWGYINTAGNYILQPKYDRASAFNHREAIVGFRGKLMIIDPIGKKIREIVEQDEDAGRSR